MEFKQRKSEFRVWDKKDKYFLEFTSIVDENFSDEGIRDAQTYRGFYDPRTDTVRSIFDFLAEPDKYAVTQYLSYKCKENTKISVCEGDIISLHFFVAGDGGEEDEVEKEKCLVFWDETGFCVKEVGEHVTEEYMNTDKYFDHSLSYLPLHMDSFRILGNIFENPDLLEK